MKRKLALLALLPLAMLGCQKTGVLGGTHWNVVEVISTSEPLMGDMDIEFGTDGIVHSKIHHTDGSLEESRCKYSVYRSLIVVERDEKPDLEVLHVFHDGDLILTDEEFQARLRRTN